MIGSVWLVLALGPIANMLSPWMRLTVCDDNRVTVFNGLVGNGCSEVNSEEDRVFLYPGVVERSFKQHCNGAC